MPTQGRRIFVPQGGSISDLSFDDGDYCLNPVDGKVWHRLPGTPYVTRTGTHTIEEHEDGTITVSPSILSKFGDGTISWHGWLRRGVWTTV